MALDPISYNLIKKNEKDFNQKIDTINNNIDTINNDIDTINNDIAKNKIYSETHDIDSGDSYTIDTSIFDIDFTKAVYNIKYLDSDNYIESDSVYSVSIAQDGSSVTIKNNSDDTQTFLITIYTYQ